MLGLASEPAIRLAERLVPIVPPGLTKVFYSDSGATATEVAFKLAAQYWYNVGRPEKNEFVGFAEAYHGDTMGAMSVGRVPAFHKPYFPMLFKVHFAPSPYVYRSSRGRQPARGEEGGRGEINDARTSAHGYRADAENVRQDCLRALEDILREGGPRIAAVCIEPMAQGAGGMIVQPPGFLSAVAALAKRYDVLLIADEVATGFGRTGRMFACEHEGVHPDLMCVAKGISGGYLPLAATFATQRIFDAFLGDPWEGRTFYHGHTYTGNPLACAAALASLELFGRNAVVENVATNAPKLAAMLDDLRDLPHVGDVRQLGYMVGIELVEDRATRRPFDAKRRVGAEVCNRIRARGVILRPLGDVIVLMPPPAMGTDDLRTIVNAVRAEVGRLMV
jgi:lysine--8-amino-7-oxononanoate aminotransferase